MLKLKTCCGIDLVENNSMVELVTNERFNKYLDDYQFDDEKEIEADVIYDTVQHRWIINMDVLTIKWKDLMNENKEK